MPKGAAEDLLKRITDKSKNDGADILVVNGELVFGADHVRSALYHAKRAIDEKRNASDSVAIETLLYISGERQLSSAIRKMAVSDDTGTVVVAHLGGASVSPEEGWMPMPDRPGTADIARLKRFGISDKEIESVSADKVVELVLERVAAVDILKK